MSDEYEAPPFRPPPGLRGAHFQTLWPNLLRRSAPARTLLEHSRTEILETEDGDRLRIHWGSPSLWRAATDTGSESPPAAVPERPDRSANEPPGTERPVMIVLHGLTGCAGSSGVLGVAAKALEAGFETVRVDLRNAFGSTTSVGVGHAGRSEDVRTVLDHVATERPEAPIAIVGFSLGGNVALKAGGEYGDDAPDRLKAVIGISVPIDLDRACTQIDAASNWIYRRYFLGRLRRIVADRVETHPDVYGDIDVPATLSIRDFDDAVVAPTCGFESAVDYYTRSSARRFLPDIRVPTLLIEAEDDPFIPFDIYDDERIRDNSRIRLLSTRHGGHAGFWSPDTNSDPGPFWAEHRAVEFALRQID